MTPSGNYFEAVNRSLGRWIFFLAYALFLYVAFTLPAKEIPPAVSRANDKLLHLLIFLILALLSFRTFSGSSLRFFYSHAIGKAGGFSLAYGGFLEWMQRDIPGRSASLIDFAADAIGILTACALMVPWQGRR